jgi:hypothetical protein
LIGARDVHDGGSVTKGMQAMCQPINDFVSCSWANK